MNDALLDFIRLIGTGCMHDAEMQRIADEATQAYADPEAFLAANPDINYDDSFPIPLGEWIVLGSLPDTVLFQADTYVELFEAITASFDQQVAFTLKPKQLAKADPLTALNRIQVQMGALNKEAGGYVLLNFSQLLDDELQMVMVGRDDLAAVLALGEQVGIRIEPALEALKVAVHV